MRGSSIKGQNRLASLVLLPLSPWGAYGGEGSAPHTLSPPADEAARTRPGTDSYMKLGASPAGQGWMEFLGERSNYQGRSWGCSDG